MKRPILTFGTLLFAAASHAQYVLDWTGHLNGPSSIDDTASNFVLDDAGNSYVVGSINGTSVQSNASISKRSASGQLLWSQSYNGPANSQDFGADICLSGNAVYIVGRVLTVGASSDISVVKYDATTGAFQWARHIDGPGHGVDGGVACAADQAGNVFITGFVWNDEHFFSNGDYLTAKINSNGDTLWTKLYHGLGNYIAISDYPTELAVDQNGDVIVTGDSPGPSNISDYATIKYNGQNGDILWEQRYTGTGQTDVPRSIAIATNGDVIVGGSSRNGTSSIAIVRYEGTTGNVQWVNSGLSTGGYGLRYSMVLDPQDNVSVTTGYDPDFDDSNLNNNLLTAKFSGLTGELMWETRYGINTFYDWQSPRTINADPAGNVVIVARESFPNEYEHFLIQKYESLTGLLLWSETLDGTFPGTTEARRVRFDAEGNLVMMGNAFQSATSGTDIFMAKFVPGQALAFGINSSMNAGSVTSGNIVDTHHSDNQVLSAQSTSNNLSLDIVTYTPVYSPSQFQFSLESRTSEPNCRGQIQLKNVQTNKWDTVQKFTSQATDHVISFTQSASTASYVSSTDRSIRARITWNKAATSKSRITTFGASIDTVTWTVTP